MKKIVLMLAAGLLLTFSGFSADEKNANDNRALQATRKLSSELQLNERTFIQVRDLNISKFQELDKVAAMFANDASLKQAKIREVENRYNEQISNLLTPVQKNNFAAYLSRADQTNEPAR